MSTFLQIIGALIAFFVMGAVFGSGDVFAGWVFERLRSRREDARDSEASVILADGTKFPVAEIPRTRSGSVDPAWLDEHCACGKPHGVPSASMGAGGYL